MKPRTWIIAVALGFALTLGALLLLIDQLGKAQIESWSQIKYSPKQRAAELPIEVVGECFAWRVRYPGSRRLQNDPQVAEKFAQEAEAGQAQADDVRLVNELRLWKGASVHIHLKAGDVLHSFTVPGFRLRQDARPGKVVLVQLAAEESNVAWDVHANTWTRTDAWDFDCAEHPGKMKGQLLVHETKDDFLKWLRSMEVK